MLRVETGFSRRPTAMSMMSRKEERKRCQGAIEEDKGSPSLSQARLLSGGNMRKKKREEETEKEEKGRRRGGEGGGEKKREKGRSTGNRREDNNTQQQHPTASQSPAAACPEVQEPGATGRPSVYSLRGQSALGEAGPHVAEPPSPSVLRLL